ncbi:FAD-dependent oxidoreductase [Streptomyces sp. NPDC088794]|uniref:FAD-dependent oxidoreductase n=1 Tax=Streptomyces sp. NPDC088794 TaxID=3365902 RepID=UPI00380F7AC3
MSARTSAAATARPRRAIVIGGGLTAMLAARVLSSHADVVVIERDLLPDRPEHRKGLPQAHHVHVLWSGGAEAIGTLLPGALAELKAQGARRIPLTSGMVALSPKGWFRRWQESHYAIACHRDLLDWVVRGEVLGRSGKAITVMEQTTVLGLTGSADAVTGVDIRRADGKTDSLRADLVVDASGRGSQTPVWLNQLGAPGPASREVDCGLVYASRLYKAPAGLPESWPIINVQADPRGNRPGQAGVILPIEDERWLVTLSGTRGGEPTNNTDDFTDFALGLRHPIVGEMIKKASPIGPVQLTRMTGNRRRFYEKTALPDNLLVLGDALAAYNPTYGHGMSVAAQSAVTLQEMIHRYGWAAPGLTKRVQKAVAQHVAIAWTFAAGTDVFYENATEHGPNLSERIAARFVDRLTYTATGSGRIARDLTDVMTLQAGPERLFRPTTLIAAARGPLKPQLTAPPLSIEEQRAIDSP